MFSFEKIGVKIKILAEVLMWIGIAASAIFALTLIFSQQVLYGILVCLLGMVASWVSSLVLYGFGELVDNSTQIRKYLNKDNK